MNLKKLLRLSVGAFFALPMSIFFANQILANHLFEKTEYELKNEYYLACGGGGGGGGGGGMSPAARKEKKAQKAKTKLNFKKRKLAEAAAAGESTSQLEAEIKELEALLAK